MSRTRHSITTKQRFTVSLALAAFCCAAITSARPATAQELSPFDPVFAPATGAGEEAIEIPLARRINPVFLESKPPRETVAVEPAVDKSPSPETEPETTDVQTSEPTTQIPLMPTSERVPPSSGLLADLLRLFGFATNDRQEARKDKEGPTPANTKTALNKPAESRSGPARIPERPAVASAETSEPEISTAEAVSQESAAPEVEQPDADEPELVETPDLGDTSKAELEPEQQAEEEPVSELGSSEADSENLLDQFTSWFEENTNGTGSSNQQHDQTPRVSIDLPPPPETKETIPEAPEPSVQPDETETTSLEEIAEATPEPEAVEETLPVETADVAPEPETVPEEPVQEAALSDPGEIPQTEKPMEDSGFFSELFGEPDSPEAASQPEDKQLPSQSEETQSVSPPAETKPLPTIARKEPDPTVVDIVSQFFSGGTVERATPPREARGPVEPREPAVDTEEPKTTVTQRTVVVSRTPSSEPTPEEQETPLVDAAIADAKRLKIDPVDETAFAVDIAVPASDEILITEEKLILGAEGHLGRPIPFSEDPAEHCVRRYSGKTWICLESLGWPAVIADAFKSPNIGDRRTRAIVRYDGMEATQYRVSFPTESFDRIRFHFEYLLGPPEEVPDVWVPIFAEPKRMNRVLRWVAEKVGEKPAAILEMREIDDVRWMESPNVTQGVVRLYRQGSKPVFSMVMSADLRLIEVRNIGKREMKYTTQP